VDGSSCTTLTKSEREFICFLLLEGMNWRQIRRGLRAAYEYSQLEGKEEYQEYLQNARELLEPLFKAGPFGPPRSPEVPLILDSKRKNSVEDESDGDSPTAKRIRMRSCRKSSSIRMSNSRRPSSTTTTVAPTKQATGSAAVDSSPNLSSPSNPPDRSSPTQPMRGGNAPQQHTGPPSRIGQVGATVSDNNQFDKSIEELGNFPFYRRS
jgi:hypothetical protein